MKTFVVEGLQGIRKAVEKLRPEACCRKGTMCESNGRKTQMCVSDCPWSKLELLIASTMVDAEILEKK